jgi:peptidyl-prolyl cis-trans isomerase C
MVPAFDKVVFNEEIGKVHGPIATPFGYHLILISDRE